MEEGIKGLNGNGKNTIKFCLLGDIRIKVNVGILMYNNILMSL